MGVLGPGTSRRTLKFLHIFDPNKTKKAARPKTNRQVLLEFSILAADPGVLPFVLNKQLAAVRGLSAVGEPVPVVGDRKSVV